MARQLTELTAKEVPFADVLGEERKIQAATFQYAIELAGNKDTFKDAKVQNGAELMMLCLLAPEIMRAVRDASLEWIDEQIRLAHQAYTPQALLVPTPDADLARISWWKQYREIFPKAHFKRLDSDAHNYLLAVAFALRAYRLEHGTEPEQLAALAPDYLTALPNDPFAVTGAFRYRKTADDYLLYSLGPDGKDDNGKPIINEKEIGLKRIVTNLDNVGDIVVGVNDY